MGKEIERKFLVIRDDYRLSEKRNSIQQGYLCNETEQVVRVRLYNKQAFLTIKGKTIGITRNEWEYPIPYEDAAELMQLCKGVIEKVRYEVDFKGSTWEVDEFHGQNEGLIVAEIELKSEKEDIPIPEWVGREVTDDPKYLNANLVKNPYQCW
ncbi:MAG TPA: adenylate cyclase [Firmicutes bacterium]|jgi:adenylate cyclase|nr:adenylate cyclase [Bacillota bacterium]